MTVTTSNKPYARGDREQLAIKCTVGKILDKSPLDRPIAIWEFVKELAGTDANCTLIFIDKEGTEHRSSEIQDFIKEEAFNIVINPKDFVPSSIKDVSKIASLKAEVTVYGESETIRVSREVSMIGISLKGNWTDAEKNPINETNLKDKKEIYFHIKTTAIKDGTIAKLTLTDKDILLDDEISTIECTINDNEAFVAIDLQKIKLTLLELIKEDGDSKIELYVKIKIEDYALEEKLAEKDKENLMLEGGIVGIGTRSLGNTPTPDTIPFFMKGHPAILGMEKLLDWTNAEIIHEHIAFPNLDNIGFSKALKKNNEDGNGHEYGMLQTDPEMSGIKDTKSALAEFDWDLVLVDEDSMREAIYQVINESRYAVSDTIAKMNADDIKKARRSEGTKETKPQSFSFTKIIRYSIEEGRRYRLIGDNCQNFVQRVRDQYESLVDKAKKNEKL